MDATPATAGPTERPKLRPNARFDDLSTPPEARVGDQVTITVRGTVKEVTKNTFPENGPRGHSLGLEEVSIDIQPSTMDDRDIEDLSDDDLDKMIGRRPPVGMAGNRAGMMAVILAVLSMATDVIAAPPTRVVVRDSSSAQAITTFPAAGRAYDVFNNAFVQSLQQYVDDRAAHQESGATATISAVKTFAVSPVFTSPLANLTLNSATLSGPIFSGTIIGTYTLGGAGTVPGSLIPNNDITDAKIASITSRGKLPSAIAYEDENNIFTGTISSTVPTGTAPLTVASTTKVANLNADTLDGFDWSAPGIIGGATPGIGVFTDLSVGVGSTLWIGGSNGIVFRYNLISNVKDMTIKPEDINSVGSNDLAFHYYNAADYRAGYISRADGALVWEKPIVSQGTEGVMFRTALSDNTKDFLIQPQDVTGAGSYDLSFKYYSGSLQRAGYINRSTGALTWERPIITTTLTASGTVSSTKACATGYTRMGPNFCRVDNFTPQTFTDSASCTAYTFTGTLPADAKSVLMRLEWRALAFGSAGPTGGAASFYSTNTCSAGTDVAYSSFKVYEYAGLAGGTEIGVQTDSAIVPLVATNTVYAIGTPSANGSADIANYGAEGYFD